MLNVDEARYSKTWTKLEEPMREVELEDERTPDSLDN